MQTKHISDWYFTLNRAKRGSGGRAARREARTTQQIEFSKYIERKIPNFEIFESSIADALKYYENKKIIGEFTIIIDQCGETSDEATNHDHVIKILLDKYSPSDTATIVSKLTSINKKIIYKHILSIRQKG